MKKIIFCPAKINISLAITGVREDGYHNLISLVCPISFGDELEVSVLDSSSCNQKDIITCNDETVPVDESNLVIKAAIEYRKKTSVNKYFKFHLTKRTPHGAGLGGGSSDGAKALEVINELCSNLLSEKQIEDISLKLGSDCPLFLRNSPIIMEGTGEKISNLPVETLDYLRSLHLCVFKPDFSISTAWAYGKMKQNKDLYVDEKNAKENLLKFVFEPKEETLPLFNNMQTPAFEKFPSLKIVLEKVNELDGVKAIMSGSGSACFALTRDLSKLEEVEKIVKSCFGDEVFIKTNLKLI